MIAEAPRPRCGPCWYADFQAHHKACPICQVVPTANEFCSTGLALLDLALGDAGLPTCGPTPTPTNAMTLDLSGLTVTALADELRRWEDHAVHPWMSLGDEERRKQARRFAYMNAAVRSGVVSDWKPGTWP